MTNRRFEPTLSDLESRIALSGPGTITTAEWWPYLTPPPPLKILAPPPPTTPTTTVIV